MKKIIPHIFSILFCSFIGKTILKSTVMLTAIKAKAQFGFYYTPSDSIWHNQGGWSLKDLYIQKDSTSYPYSSLWRFTSKIVEARSLSAGTSNESHDTLVCVNSNGRFLKRSTSSLTLSASQVTTALGGNPIYVEVDGSISNEIQILSLSGQSISISSGNTIVIPTQTVGLAPQVNSDWNSISGVNQVLNKPTNLSQFSNGPGYITGYTETDPTVPANVKSISAGDITNWNNKLSVEVDGSVSNEIQSLSLSGQSISISSGNTIIIPTQTTGLAPQVNTDWNSVSGASQLLNKPTTLSGYGITDAQSKLNGTGFVKASGTTISYDNSTYLTSETDPLFNTKFATKTTSDLTEGTNLYYTAARTRTTVSAGTGISYNNSTGVITNSSPDQVVTLTAGNNDVTITGSYPNFTITPYIPTTFTVTRAINSSTFQVSSTRHADAVYNIGISCTASIGSNASGTVLLQYSLNGGTTWINASEIKNSNTVTLAVALQSVNNQESVIAMNGIPAGAILRLSPTIVGTTTITYIQGFETY